MYCYLNRVDCKYADMNGWCDSTVCHNMNLLANCHNLEVGTVPTQENKPQSHWHTEPPTEEGDYVVLCSTDGEYMVCHLEANLKPEIFHKYFKAWWGEKIEPYTEKEDVYKG